MMVAQVSRFELNFVEGSGWRPGTPPVTDSESATPGGGPMTPIHWPHDDHPSRRLSSDSEGGLGSLSGPGPGERPLPGRARGAATNTAGPGSVKCHGPDDGSTGLGT